MQLAGHVLERFLTHLFMGCSFVLIGTFALDLLNRKKKWSFLPKNLEQTIITAAILSLPFIFMREPWDVASGGWVGKSYFDFVSWFLGIGLPAWGLIRLIRRAKEER